MSLFRKWGFGAELVFDSGRAIANIGRAQRSVTMLRRSFSQLRDAGNRVTTGLGQIGTLLTPLGIGFGFAAAKASSLAGNLEAQKLTMRILVGDMGKANQLLAMIRENAAATPFKEGDLIEGSKRLLRLTGENIDRNFDLLKTMETMAALSPGKSVVDAVEGLLDATSGGGFERLKEFGFSLRAEDFAANGRPGGQAWADAVIDTIQKELQQKTRGEDLVGALSQTFIGRLSTLQDAVENVGKGVGETLNESLGPAVIFLTELLKENADDIVEGFRSMMTRVRGVWSSTGQPVLDRILAAWEKLGEDGRARLFSVIFAVAALITALAPVFAVLAVAGFGIGGVITVLSAVVPLIGAVGSALAGAVTFLSAVVSSIGGVATALALPTVIVAGGVIVGVMAAIAAAIVGAGAGFQHLADRSAFVTNTLPFAIDKAWAAVVTRFGQVKAFALGVAQGFREGIGPVITEVLTGLQPPFDELVKLVIDLLDEFGTVNSTAGDFATSGKLLGSILSGVVAPGIRLVAFGMRSLIELGRILVPVFEGVFRNFNRLQAVVFGLADGSLSAGDAMSLLLLTVQQNLLTTLRIVVGTMLRTMERVLQFIANRVANIPGLGGLFSAGVDMLAGGVGGIAEDVDRSLDRAIRRIDRQAGEIERARVAAASPTINVEQAPVEVTANVTTKVCVEDNEIARAAGSAAVRAGERGTGPALPAQQRGRVLRRGLVVTPLGPSEAF